MLLAAAAVGVAGSFLTTSMGRGIGNAMVETAVSTELGHVQVHPAGYELDPGLHRRFFEEVEPISQLLAQGTQVRAWAPRLRADGLISSSHSSSAFSLMGVDPDAEAGVSTLAESVVTGGFLDGSQGSIVLGEELAERLAVSVGQKVVVSLQDGANEMANEAVRVRGILRTPFPEFDANTALMTLDDARRLLGVGASVSEFVVLSEDREDLDALIEQLRSGLSGNVEIRSWRELRPVLVFAVEYLMLNAAAMYLTVFIATAFGIAGVLYMAVHERIPEFGVLASIGMRPGRIVLLVMIEALLLVALGTLLGVILGVAGVRLMQGGVPLGAMGALGAEVRVVPAFLPRQLLVPAVLAAVAAVGGSLAPAIRAARLAPVAATRHT